MDLTDVFRLDGKVAIVTGGSYGLGVLFAEVLASAGADVVVTARSTDKLEETRKLVENVGRRGLAVGGDITVYGDCERVVDETMQEFGRIDVLVNNAGWADDRLVRTERCEPEMFQQMVQTDLVGLFFMTRAAAPHMLRGGGGGIINLSSIFGMAGSENRTAGYFAAKGGVNQLTRLLACEWGDRNLRVNALRSMAAVA
jgi:NAD(P)-dependent dehydrogenase (short-subunit alcohol dehydrogenase family)